MTQTANFETFRTGPAADLLRRVFRFDLAGCVSWDDYTTSLLAHRAALGGDEKFAERARSFDAVASSGERPLLQACLQAADYAWLADELAKGEGEGFWQRAWQSLSGDYALAVACVIARQN